jgi:hypothetical protein
MSAGKHLKWGCSRNMKGPIKDLKWGCSGNEGPQHRSPMGLFWEWGAPVQISNGAVLGTRAPSKDLKRGWYWERRAPLRTSNGAVLGTRVPVRTSNGPVLGMRAPVRTSNGAVLGMRGSCEVGSTPTHILHLLVLIRSAQTVQIQNQWTYPSYITFKLVHAKLWEVLLHKFLWPF